MATHGGVLDLRRVLVMQTLQLDFRTKWVQFALMFPSVTQTKNTNNNNKILWLEGKL